METLDNKQEKITFRAEVSESLVNAIRRYLNHIPVLAIDEVEIFKNGSALYDETVAHRIGLIPIKTNKAINEKTKGTLKISSKKEGFVHSGEFSGDVDVVYENIPITFLDKEQELELLATAKAGKGKEHVKFSPGTMFYRVVSEIEMDKQLFEEVKKVYPKIEYKEKANKIILLDNGVKEIRDFCEGLAKRLDKKIEVTNKDELIITLESFGQLKIQDIIKKSVEALKQDLAEVSKKVK